MLDIVIKKDPSGEWNSEEGDRHTDLAIDGYEFEEIQKFVDVSLPQTEQPEDEKWIDYHQRLKDEYLKAASEKDYEMLGRIWDWYDDAIYYPSELNQLREECLRVKEKSQNPSLTIAVNKILAACDDAMTTNSGLLFGCD